MDAEPATQVEEAFDLLEDRGVAVTNDGEVDDEVYRHLQELGYA